MPNINSSLLALRRKRLGYEQKQIALLLGHKSTFQLSRYETGQRIPSLKEAIKLSILLGIPIQAILGAYFRRCFEELEKEIRKSGLTSKINLQKIQEAEYCTYLEIINSDRSNEFDDKVRRHIKILVEERSKRIQGN